MTRDLHRKLNWMTRSDIQKLLERHGFAVHENETTAELREAVFVNVEDGTIPEEDLDG